ncbi:MAG: methylenetetrahydrofolate reductase C-terminal domain-containing protein [Bacillota bacterium]
MIVAERKPLDEVLQRLDGYRKILVAGCSECVTVCQAGGEKEVEVLASLLRLRGFTDVVTDVLTRQCDVEFLPALDLKAAWSDCIVSLACGVGVQFLAERYRDRWVIPGLNTKFGGGAREPGVWEERCGFCGECVLHLTGGVCPIIRCSKSLLNGPCGGSQNGKCEIRDEVECAWQLIYDRLKGLGRLDLLAEPIPPKDWSHARDGGPRKVKRTDVMAV